DELEGALGLRVADGFERFGDVAGERSLDETAFHDSGHTLFLRFGLGDYGTDHGWGRGGRRYLHVRDFDHGEWRRFFSDRRNGCSLAAGCQKVEKSAEDHEGRIMRQARRHVTSYGATPSRVRTAIDMKR